MSSDNLNADKQLTVFLSYSHTDRERVEQLTAALQKAGINVWWDALIEGGAAFAKSIEAALEAADVLVVAWSASSVASDWVRDEAAHGRDRGRFVPISLDGTPPPLGFRQYHFINFTQWRGDAEAVEVKQVLHAITTGSAGAPADTAHGASTTQGKIGRRTLLGAAGAAVFGGGYFGWQSLSGGVADNSIAVMPFANLSGDASQSYFSDGLSEELRARLGQTGQFKVAAQASSNLFRDHKADAVSAAAKLGVAYLLDGSVRRAGDTVRIATQLIEARSGLSKWSQSYDSTLSNVFTVQSEIAAMVVQAIAGQIGAAAQKAVKQSPGTSNIAAYDAYLKGREQYQLDIDKDSDAKALAYFDAAIAADPNYAQAHAARAEALLDLGANYTKASELPSIYATALTAAQKAVALAPNLAIAQLALGDALFTGKLDARAARPYYERAYALGQNNAEILELFAFYASKTGRTAEAFKAIDQAITLDPLNPLMFRAKGKFLYAARRYPEAIALLRQALSMNPKLSSTSAFIGHVLVMQGKYTEARVAYLAEPREYLRQAGIVIVNDKLGKHVDAKTEQAALVLKYGDVTLYQQAQISAQRGDHNAAIMALTKAHNELDSGVTMAGSDPLFDTLRGDQRFIHLLNDIGLQ